MSDSKRRLAPAPTGGNAGSDSHQRRKNVGTACLACKARKLKVRSPSASNPPSIQPDIDHQ